jgi:hypothetical protein
MTRRMTALFICLFLAATPLMWFSVDSNSGEKLLRVLQWLERKAPGAKDSRPARP